MNKLTIKKIVIGLTILFLILTTVRIYPFVIQEENRFLIFNGIIKLYLKNLDTFEYDSNSMSRQYITNNKDGFKAINNMLQKEGWIFKEQFGSGFLFENLNDKKENITIGSTQFSRYFKLWNIPQIEEEENEEGFREMTEEEAEVMLQIIKDAGNMFNKLKDQGNPSATQITVEWLKEQSIIKDVYVSDTGDIFFEFEIGLQASILNRNGGEIPEF